MIKSIYDETQTYVQFTYVLSVEKFSEIIFSTV